MIYVDNPIHPWRGKLWCHLVADDIQELHDFARRLGLKKEWFQDHRIQPHYDITEAKRKQAIANGAKAISTEEMAQRVVLLINKKRENA